MSMSTYVQGIRPSDSDWKKMKAVYDTCEIAGVPIPDEVEKFFNYEPPNPLGVEVDIKSAVSKSTKDSYEYLDVHLDKLPQGIKILCFVNSY